MLFPDVLLGILGNRMFLILEYWIFIIIISIRALGALRDLHFELKAVSEMTLWWRRTVPWDFGCIVPGICSLPDGTIKVMS